MTRKVPPVPRGLARGPGASLWRAVVGQYSLRADELVVLDSACRQVELVAKLERELTGSKLIVAGSKGQDVPHPLLGELRASRALVASLLRQLGLPDEPGAERPAENNSSKAQRAARARWDRKGSRGAAAS